MEASTELSRRIEKRNHRITTTLTTILWLPLLICARPCSSAHAQASNDSAGVRIVHYENASRRAQWHVDKAPVLEIGGSQGEINTEFSQIVGVAILQSGAIAVANSGTSELRYFDSRGRFLRSVGRAGQGPGEFEIKMVGLRRIADTLVATDAAQRAQVFAPDGTLLRSQPRPSLGSLVPYGDRIGFMTDGRSVMMAMQPVASASSGRVQQYFVMVFVPPTPGGLVSEVRRFPAFELHFGGPVGPQPVWYGPSLRATVSQQRICVGYSKFYEIDCFDANGTQTTRIERSSVPRKVGDSDREFITARVQASIPKAPAEMRARLEASMKSYVYAERVPAFGPFLSATTGELWVREFDNSDAMGEPPRGGTKQLTWSVYGPRGEWVADVSLPPRFAPYDVGPNYVAGVSFDDNDVERVTVLRLRR